MKVDWNNLRHVIERGVIEAAHDAGVERVAIRVIIDALPDGTPAISVEVCELSPSDLARMRPDDDKHN